MVEAKSTKLVEKLKASNTFYDFICSWLIFLKGYSRIGITFRDMKVCKFTFFTDPSKETEAEEEEEER